MCMTEFCGSSDYCNKCINNPNGDKRKMTIKGMDAKEYRKKYYEEHKMYYKNKLKEWRNNNTEKYKETTKRNNQKRIKLVNERITELEAENEKIKLQYDYAFNQLCESREIICSMLSQYRDNKEIDYSTKERGEKLLKQGVYKND